MAGIGFQLKRIIEEDNGFIHSIKSYGLAVVALNGPMLLCLLAISIAGLLLNIDTYSSVPRDNILVTITYSFVVSSITTGTYSLILTRYISDCIYQKQYSKVMASFYGGMIPAIFFSILISISLFMFAGLRIEYAVGVMLLLSIVSMIWLEMIYLSAVNDNKGITIGFLAGNTVIILMLLLLRFIPKEFELIYIFLSFITGFFVTALLLMVQIRSVFKEGDKCYFEWLSYMKKYPDLWLTGLFYTLGLYFPCLYYRFTSENFIVNGFLTMQKDFDMPFYISVMCIIPGLVFFSVKFETQLHTKCNEFFSAITNYGTYNEIKFLMERLKKTILYFFYKLCIVQLTVLSTVIFFSFKFGNGSLNNFKTHFILWMCIIAMSATLIMYVAKIVLLYFDERLFAFIIASFYAIAVALMTILINKDGFQGTGFMVASVSTAILAYILMKVFLRKLRNLVFMIRQ